MNAYFDLEDRTYNYALNIRKLFRGSKFKYDSDVQQLIRSSGSVGANYIEANEALSKKDFVMRVKISRKEVKESIYWLKLLAELHENLEIESLMIEGGELLKIFSSIINKCEEMRNSKFK